MAAAVTFALPDDLVARTPPERRGLARDRVRLLVLDRATHERWHTRFDQISRFLRSGDLLVFNASRTLPAALDGRDLSSGTDLEVRLAQQRPDGSWLALLVCRQGEPFACGLRPGLRLHFGESLSAVVEERDTHIPRLWVLRFSREGVELMDRLHRLGRPIRYEHVSSPWPLQDYQTVYASQPGSAEMPSAGRAFTWQLLFGLRRRGVATTSLVLHTGLSSYLDDELDARHPMAEEEYFIGDNTADQIASARRQGGRVIAVGTTVVRALESVASNDGKVTAGHGYTRLRITAEHPLQVVDGLLTGLHEPEASHLDLLTAFAPVPVIQEAYAEAVTRGYLWHEFGDLNLILPV
jgi:S-adenosylmethionine:tRNA ribosyltransferase-isomerase